MADLPSNLVPIPKTPQNISFDIYQGYGRIFASIYLQENCDETGAALLAAHLDSLDVKDACIICQTPEDAKFLFEFIQGLSKHTKKMTEIRLDFKFLGDWQFLSQDNPMPLPAHFLKTVELIILHLKNSPIPICFINTHKTECYKLKQTKEWIEIFNYLDRILQITKNLTDETSLNLNFENTPLRLELLRQMFNALKMNTRIREICIKLDLNDADIFLKEWPNLAHTCTNVSRIYLDFDFNKTEDLKLSDENVRALTNIVGNIGSESISILNLSKNNLWKLNFQVLRGLIQASRQNKFLKSLEFWTDPTWSFITEYSHPYLSSRYTNVISTFESAKQVEFSEILSRTDDFYDLSILASIPLSVANCLIFFSQHLEKDPKAITKIVEATNTCLLLPGENREELVSHFRFHYLIHIIKENRYNPLLDNLELTLNKDFSEKKLSLLCDALRNCTRLGSLHLTIDLNSDSELPFTTFWKELANAWRGQYSSLTLSFCWGEHQEIKFSQENIEAIKQILANIGSQLFSILYLDIKKLLSSKSLNFKTLTDILAHAHGNPLLNQIDILNKCYAYEAYQPLEVKSFSEQLDYEKQVEFTEFLLSLLHQPQKFHHSPFPVPLQAKDYIRLFSNFLEEFPEELQKVEEWVATCPLLPNEKRGDLLAPFIYKFLENPQCYRFNNIQFNSEFAQDLTLQSIYLARALNSLTLKMNPYDPKIDFEQASQFINKLNTYNLTLKLDLSYIPNQGIQPVLKLLQIVRTKSEVLTLDLSNNELHKCDIKLVQELIQSLANGPFNWLELGHNHLNELKPQDLLRLIDTLNKVSTLRRVVLAENTLCSLDFKLLMDIRDRVLHPQEQRIFPFYPNDILPEVYQHWNHEQQKEFFRIYLQTSGSWPPFLYQEEFCKLSQQDYFEIFKEFLTFRGYNSYSIKSGLQNYEGITQEHKLELYFIMLSMFKHFEDEDDLLRLIDPSPLINVHDLNNAPHAIKPFLSIVNTTLSNISDIEEEESGEDSLQKECLPQIRKACALLWPNNPFYDSTLNILENFCIKSDDDFRKLSNMTQWFLWTMLLLWHKSVNQCAAHLPSALSSHPHIVSLITDYLPKKEKARLNFFFEETSMVLESLAEYRSPSERISLTRTFINHLFASPPDLPQETKTQNEFNTANGVTIFRTLTQGKKKTTYKLLPILATTEIILNNQSPQQSKDIWALGVSFIQEHLHNGYKDFPARNPLVGALSLLAQTETKELTSLDILRLIKAVLCPKDPNPNPNPKLELQNQIQNWLLIQGLASLQELPKLKDSVFGKDNLSIQQAAKALIQRFFELGKDEIEVFQSTFGALKHPSLVLTYFGKLRSLGNPSGEALLKLYREFIRSVLSKNQEQFYRLRYDTSRSPHLTRVFTDQTELKERWQQKFEVDLSLFLSTFNIRNNTSTNIQFDVFLKNCLRNNHLDPKDYSELLLYLETPNASTKQDITQSISKYFDDDDFDLNTCQDKKLLRLYITQQLIQLLETPESDKKAQFKCLRTVSAILKRKLQEAYEFQNDLRSVISFLKDAISGRPLPNLKEWKIGTNASFWNYFLSGYNLGSCQRPDGDPYLNQCLLAFCLDGKNELLFIQNEQGEIIARSYLRLLLAEDYDANHQKTEHPALFRETIYPQALHTLFRQALEHFSRMMARFMKVPLHTLEGQDIVDSYQHPHPLRSYGSIAPSEYVDAVHRKTNGIFEISTSQVIVAKPGELEVKTALEIRRTLTPYFEIQNAKTQAQRIVTIVEQYAIDSEHPDLELEQRFLYNHRSCR